MECCLYRCSWFSHGWYHLTRWRWHQQWRCWFKHPTNDHSCPRLYPSRWLRSHARLSVRQLTNMETIKTPTHAWGFLFPVFIIYSFKLVFSHCKVVVIIFWCLYQYSYNEVVTKPSGIASRTWSDVTKIRIQFIPKPVLGEYQRTICAWFYSSHPWDSPIRLVAIQKPHALFRFLSRF